MRNADELVCECPLLVGFGSTAGGSMSSEGGSMSSEVDSVEGCRGPFSTVHLVRDYFCLYLIT